MTRPLAGRLREQLMWPAVAGSFQRGEAGRELGLAFRELEHPRAGAAEEHPGSRAGCLAPSKVFPVAPSQKDARIRKSGTPRFFVMYPADVVGWAWLGEKTVSKLAKSRSAAAREAGISPLRLRISGSPTPTPQSTRMRADGV